MNSKVRTENVTHLNYGLISCYLPRDYEFIALNAIAVA